MGEAKDCACRDCYEDCFTWDGGWTLCRKCIDKGCMPLNVRIAFYLPRDYDCLRDDLYGT